MMVWAWGIYLAGIPATLGFTFGYTNGRADPVGALLFAALWPIFAGGAPLVFAGIYAARLAKRLGA